MDYPNVNKTSIFSSDRCIAFVNVYAIPKIEYPFEKFWQDSRLIHICILFVFVHTFALTRVSMMRLKNWKVETYFWTKIKRKTHYVMTGSCYQSLNVVIFQRHINIRLPVIVFTLGLVLLGFAGPFKVESICLGSLDANY